ncbi:MULTISPECIES: hypothetical protein [Pseudomonas]|uniref:Uncharacterized protein n=1 Tax=Pseudomonas quercus TaxID=2722792 RepID=A0ABX0YH25_9PSED|nr:MULTISPECIES: hypothetical protein [Pseudomonas]MBF7144138.1 hypothetical protein [Pseudomonas sp. LY10J]NJP02730.1 hypothetical protein [Pseudomonas quercus]
MDWTDFLLNTLVSASAGTVLTGLLAFLFKTWITERLTSSIRHEYDSKLEQLKSDLKAQADENLALLKAELDLQAERLKIASASFSDVQKATIAKKIEAVDHIWGATRRARGLVPGVVTLLDVLTDEELSNLSASPQLRDMLALIRAVKPMQLLPEIFGDADIARPHVGEYIWALFSTYHGLLSRMILLVCGTRDDSDRRWFRDQGVLKLVGSAFGNQKRTEFSTLTSGQFTWLQIEFERRLFSAFDRLLTGKAFSEAALNQAVEMEQMLARVIKPDADGLVRPVS